MSHQCQLHDNMSHQVSIVLTNHEILCIKHQTTIKCNSLMIIRYGNKNTMLGSARPFWLPSHYRH